MAEQRRRRWLRVFSGLVVVLGLVIGTALLTAGSALGERATGERLARMTRSPLWHDGHFVNPQPMWNDMIGAFTSALTSTNDDASPSAAVPVQHPTAQSLHELPASGLRITWFGHSSTLVELDGVRVLTDPIWSDRPSPISSLGPRRWFAPLIALDSLPPIDAVVISHDHFDHLDQATIVAMRSWASVFLVPLGVGAHLERWGIPASRIQELDWWDSTNVRGVTIVATPARHASGRISPRSDRTLWAGYAMLGPGHRVFYSGDTGLHTTFADIGTRLGPFDVAMIEAGQYNAAWPDWHMGPEQAVEASRLVHAKVMMPVHWALFKLAMHGWTEPVERALVAGRCLGVTVITPQPGQSIDPTLADRAGTTSWWPKVPWSTVAETPIVATRNGVESERVTPAGCVR